MTKLTDTQLVILSSAAKRHDRGVILPERLKGQAARNTVERLISRGLVEEVRAEGELPVWRHDDQGRYGLRITSAGLVAIGVEPEGTVTGTGRRRRMAWGSSRSRRSGRVLPRLRRLAPEGQKRAAGDEVALKVEGVVNR